MNNYYAFNGVDKYISETFFKNKKDGYFVDIGAHDGISGNNTFYFENAGWNGICFEPIPEVFQKLKENRKCLLKNKALSDIEGTEQFFLIEGYSEMLSGLVKEYPDQHIIRINNEIQQHNQSFDYIDVNSSIFNKEVDRTDIDLLSIDTEGAEFTILKTIDFQKYNINVMVIEYNYHNQELINFLHNNGFDIVKQIEIDLIVKNRKYAY
jgi:FkbM family methyltransferase